MNCLKLENKCRICLKDNVDIHWNNFINDCSSLTYKDCYYKYTQLECFDEDNFSQMLCHTCADGLEYVDTFIEKALDTHLVLQNNNRFNVEIKDDDGDLMDQEIPEFEKILIKETNPEIENLSMNENSNEELPTTVENTKTTEGSKISIRKLNNHKKKSAKSKKSTNEIAEINNSEDEFSGQTIVNHLKIEILENPPQIDDSKKTKKLEQPMCCSICSKVLYSKYTAILHEKTHIKNRERNETCDVCGLKFYSKLILKNHMQTHSDNREKPHKCEFCDKAFYYKGGLNVHRRIHLGQLMSCSFCTNKYYRQIDLDRHMISHSAARINSNTKKKTKCYVRCKDCGKIVPSDSYRSHQAVHMNEPLFKCSICNKEFFHRDSCFKHLKKFHKKPNGEIAKFIVAYKHNRITHLYLQQKADIQVITE